jgi:hypothetical protein
VGIEKHIVEEKVQHNVDWLDDFEHGKDGPNVFDAEQVRTATIFASHIVDALDAIRASLPKVYQEPSTEPF